MQNHCWVHVSRITYHPKHLRTHRSRTNLRNGTAQSKHHQHLTIELSYQPYCSLFRHSSIQAQNDRAWAKAAVSNSAITWKSCCFTDAFKDVGGIRPGVIGKHPAFPKAENKRTESNKSRKKLMRLLYELEGEESVEMPTYILKLL